MAGYLPALLGRAFAIVELSGVAAILNRELAPTAWQNWGAELASGLCIVAGRTQRWAHSGVRVGCIGSSGRVGGEVNEWSSSSVQTSHGVGSCADASRGAGSWSNPGADFAFSVSTATGLTVVIDRVADSWVIGRVETSRGVSGCVELSGGVEGRDAVCGRVSNDYFSNHGV